MVSMTEQPRNTEYQITEEEATELTRSLLQKEGNWVNWGQMCHKLQKAGYDSQVIFERTGFQSAQQNLIIVAAQVFESLVKAGADPDLLGYYEGPRSDVLYEFRILTQDQRLAAASLGQAKRIDVDEAHDIAKAIQDFSRLSQIPSEFTRNAGDAVAYQCWKRGRQKRDLAERAKLIAKGLKFAYSTTARTAIESLLQDFTVAPSRSAPLLTVHRLQDEDELARIIPLAGRFPLTASQIGSVEAVTIEEPFRLVTVGSHQTIVPLPGWQAILKAIDPIAILWPSEQLPRSISGKAEEVLVVIDRASVEWDPNSYYLVEIGDTVWLKWFDDRPDLLLLGQLVLILRAKNIFDENNLTEPWQMDD
jgi:hypothetical protein